MILEAGHRRFEDIVQIGVRGAEVSAVQGVKCGQL
jgi:hypothetical protein